MTAEPAITGREHWTHKGPVKLQKNFRIAYHILHSFFGQPAPRYRGAGGEHA